LSLHSSDPGTGDAGVGAGTGIGAGAGDGETGGVVGMGAGVGVGGAAGVGARAGVGGASGAAQAETSGTTKVKTSNTAINIFFIIFSSVNLLPAIYYRNGNTQ